MTGVGERLNEVERHIIDTLTCEIAQTEGAIKDTIIKVLREMNGDMEERISRLEGQDLTESTQQTGTKP